MRKLAKLRVWATKRHGAQLYGDLPYCFHLMEVEQVATEFFPGDLRVREGSWGHDLLEDTDATEQELLDAGFSPDAVGDVVSVTDESGATRQEKKKKTLPKTRARGVSGIKLKLCDRVANVRHGLNSGNHAKLAKYRSEQKFFEKMLYDPAHEELAAIWQYLRTLLVA